MKLTSKRSITSECMTYQTHIISQMTISISHVQSFIIRCAENIIYWTDSGTDRLESMTMDGMNRTRLAVFPANPFYLGLVLHNDELYITHWATNGYALMHMSCRAQNLTHQERNIVNGLFLSYYFYSPVGHHLQFLQNRPCNHNYYFIFLTNVFTSIINFHVV